MNVNAGPSEGNRDALVNVHADPDTSLGGPDGTLASVLGNGDGVGDLGSVLNGQGLVTVAPEPASGSGDALVNVDTSGIDGTGILGDSTDMGLIAALTGTDGLDGVDVPVSDGPHEISVSDIPVADLHLQQDHA